MFKLVPTRVAVFYRKTDGDWIGYPRNIDTPYRAPGSECYRLRQARRIPSRVCAVSNFGQLTHPLSWTGKGVVPGRKSPAGHRLFLAGFVIMGIN
uniref:Uncharacterized protein n=1 Tax=Anopheles atroparvus TaxID=41427 RepID=A0AAG5DGR2_ANOAO